MNGVALKSVLVTTSTILDFSIFACLFIFDIHSNFATYHGGRGQGDRCWIGSRGVNTLVLKAGRCFPRIKAASNGRRIQGRAKRRREIVTSDFGRRRNALSPHIRRTYHIISCLTLAVFVSSDGCSIQRLRNRIRRERIFRESDMA